MAIRKTVRGDFRFLFAGVRVEIFWPALPR